MAARKKKRKRSIPIGSRLTVGGISAVLIILAAVMIIQTYNQSQIYNTYKERDQELQEMSEAESERTNEIEELKEKVNTDEYIEEIAIEKLGLVPKDEIIFEEEN